MNKILIIDDDFAVQTSLQLLLQQAGFQVKTCDSPAVARGLIPTFKPVLVILDLNFSIETSGEEGMKALQMLRSEFPEVLIILLTGWGTINLAVEGMKLGAKDFLTKPWKNDHLLQSVRTILDLEEKKESISTRKKLDQKFDFGHIVGEDSKLLSILETIGRVAPTDAPVLITGESGTGKELIAEAIHQNSKRRIRPFVKVNLGGISATLFESELFGHVRGAFTDAKSDRIGRFELANRGTLFLDEIGDLDLSSQVKLLRVLQDRTFEPLGSSKSKTVDVRVICATNRNLEEMVAQGTFREDLFYRINLISVKLPALRERPTDIASLAMYFADNLKVIYERPQLKISAKALQWLQTLVLPGNIRQLKNLVEKTILLSANDQLEINDFQKNVTQVSSASQSALPEVGTLTLEEMELLMIRKAMSFHQNNISRVARALGITRFALYRRLEKFGIPYAEE